MNSRSLSKIFILILSVFIFYSCNEKMDTVLDSNPGNDAQSLDKKPAAGVNVSVFVTGLNNPRGLKFGPDGYLYLAEGGLGGTHFSDGACEQVISPVGPYTGDFNARILKISSSGALSVVAQNLPSSETSPMIGSLVSGVADIAFVGNQLYALLGGAGCSHSFESVPNGIIKVNANGSWNLIANLSQWQQTHPVANPEEDDFEPDGTWFSMINVRGDLYALEPNHGDLVKVTTSGAISRVIDISASQGHIVPTALTYHGNFFVSNLHTFPVEPGSSAIYKINPAGQIQIRDRGLTAVLGLVFDKRDRMYVLEMTTVEGDPTPFTGKILRILPSGAKEEIVTGLFFPTAMTLGPDGNLYVSNKGFGPHIPGFGEILKITLN